MNWAEIAPYGNSDPMRYWFSGIYKIVTYGGGRFHAYYIKDGEKNWGWHVSYPPEKDGVHRFWPSLESAKKAAEAHSLGYSAKPKTVRRAEEILQSYLTEAA